MTTGYQFGPVDLYLIGLAGHRPDPGALAALTDLADTGLMTVLDLILISRNEDGDTTVFEATDIMNGVELEIAALGAIGLIGHEDVDAFATLIPEGATALLVAVELSYQRDLAQKTAASGGELLAFERIPAPVVNALVDSLAAEGRH
ncbi:hypothetical protein JVX90_08615 [Gordonia sp. PDNC005]|nr:hypothetical protein JVX90_08615 [Gordonia sp. PDNC005]